MIPTKSPPTSTVFTGAVLVGELILFILSLSRRMGRRKNRNDHVELE